MIESMPELLSAGLLLCVFFGISYAALRAGIPSLLMIIVVGIIVASALAENETIHFAAEIGLVLLFFILGLDFPLARIMDISKTIWPAGLLDIVLNLGAPIVFALAFKLDFLSALVIGGIVYASSSSITAKLLEENKRLANTETEFILSLLIFEDLVSPILVSFLSGMSMGETLSAGLMLTVLAKIVVLTLGAVIIGYYGFRKLSDFISVHLEMDFMPLLAVGLALLYAGLAMQLGLSEILGAFLAGVMLSETGKSPELEHLLLPIRDVTLPFFFFWFGTTLVFGESIPLVLLLVILIVWSIISKILVGVWGGKAFGLSARASYRAGFSLIQRGEFSAIIASMAIPQLRIFSGIYILISAFVGVYFFQKAPALSKWVQDKFYPIANRR